MSNALAIAAVTATLRQLLATWVPATLPAELPAALGIDGLAVTARPPDKARGTNTNNQLNLFLYQATINPTWRNMNIPQQARSGESLQPLLPLDLYYLLTAYGRDDADLIDHILLGQAMRVLHDHPLLGAAEIRDALAQAELHVQVERVHILAQPLSPDEMSKLWTTFQTQYRISTAYQVSVVLIESLRSGRTPLPVLRQGAEDRGPVALPDMMPPFPTFREVVLPERQYAVRLGEAITIRGFHLDGDDVRLLWAHPRLDEPTEQQLGPNATSASIDVTIPANVTDWPAGHYALSARIERAGDHTRVTNSVAVALAPSITLSPTAAAPGDVVLRVTCRPNILPEQRVSLLFGGREVKAPARSATTNMIDFSIPVVTAGEYVVRLRVDGVDSVSYETSGTPLQFAADQRVTIA